MAIKLMRVLGVLTVLLMLMPANSIYASAKGIDQASPALSVVAFLQDQQSGNVIQIPVVATSYGDSFISQLKTNLSSGSSGTTQKDGSSSIAMTLYIYYDTSWCSNGERCTRLLYSRGYLQRLDSQVRLSNAWMQNSCLGPFDKNKGYCGTTTTMKIGIPTTNTWYTDMVTWGSTPVATGFAGHYVASKMHVDISRGTKTWSLEVCVAQGGSTVGSCKTG